MHARHPSSDGQPVGAPAASARSRGWEFSSDESGTQKATLLALAARCNLEGANRPGGSRARRNPACAAKSESGQSNRDAWGAGLGDDHAVRREEPRPFASRYTPAAIAA